MGDSSKRQTFTATPAEPGELSFWFRNVSMSEQKLAWLFGLILGGVFAAVLFMNALAF